jgi:epoxyqueuosine reductase QueG
MSKNILAQKNTGLTKKLKELAIGIGVDLIGVAPIERFAGAPDGHKPQDILDGARSVVSVALNALEGTFSTNIFHVYQLSYALLRNRTNEISYQLAKFLERIGYSSVIIPGTVPLDMVEKKGLFGAFSHRHAAQAAGLGKIGLNQLLITEAFGPRVWLGTVITSAPLVPSSVPAQKYCLGEDCGKCLISCSPRALSLNGIDKRKCLEKGVHAENLSGLLKHTTKIFEAKKLEEKKRLLWSADTRVLYQSLVCGMIPACKNCISVCPVGKRCI